MGKSFEVMKLPVKAWEAFLTPVRRLEAARDCVYTPEPSITLSKRVSFSSPSWPSLLAHPCSHFRRDPLCARVVVALDTISKHILFVFSCLQASGSLSTTSGNPRGSKGASSSEKYIIGKIEESRIIEVARLKHLS